MLKESYFVSNIRTLLTVIPLNERVSAVISISEC